MLKKFILPATLGIILLLGVSFFMLSSKDGQTKLAGEAKVEEAEEKAFPTEEPQAEQASASATESEKEEAVAEAKETSDDTEKAKKPEEEKADEEIPSIKKYINVSTLNVRSGPETTHGVVTVLAINEEVKASSEVSKDGWVKISFKNSTGYVNSKYLADQQVVVKEEIKEEKVVSTTNNTSEKKEPAATQTERKKPAATAPTVPAKPKNDAMNLKTVGSNNQLILVTTSGYGTNSAKIQTFERNSNGDWVKVLDTSGHIGKNGFAKKKVEGDGKSPRGKYSIGTAFGQKGNPGTKLPFKAITSDDVWVDDPKSSLYNTWQSRKATEGQWSSAENMAISAYNYGFVINYNTQRVPGNGSAIFFHISSGATLGCVGTSQSNVVSILKWLNPAKSPTIIMTPSNELGSY
ncbi:SH3 domain-containing protein [Robertmurraya massiliosenegalensis]|uniref:SH3 domain-containing protein n=1 Tax=Robertmurraya massiliosenegalensis TaxID=1287657 RepID=UPI0002D6F66E|nr:SH3 domain-containing protein [Robertmurraya massiliosenegalensis]